MKKPCWVQCDSKNDLSARLSSIEGQVFDEFEADNSNTYGYLFFRENEICIPIVFSDVGLVPQSISSNGMMFVGITDSIVGYDLKTGRQVFVYRMPTVFRDFVILHQNSIVIQDETGFVLLSSDGKEEGIKLYSDVIDSYKVNGNIISGKTMDGELFRLSITDLRKK